MCRTHKFYRHAEWGCCCQQLGVRRQTPFSFPCPTTSTPAFVTCFPLLLKAAATPAHFGLGTVSAGVPLRWAASRGRSQRSGAGRERCGAGRGSNARRRRSGRHSDSADGQRQPLFVPSPPRRAQTSRQRGAERAGLGIPSPRRRGRHLHPRARLGRCRLGSRGATGSLRRAPPLHVTGGR